MEVREMKKNAKNSKHSSGCLGCLAKTATFVSIAVAFIVVSYIITPSEGAYMDLGALAQSVTSLGGVAFLVLIIFGIYRTLTR